MATEEWCYAQAQPGEAVLLARTPPRHYILDGGAVPIPSQPSPHHTFNWSSRKWEDVRTLEAVRRDLKAALAAHRWEREVGGITVGGVSVGTGREARAAFFEMLAQIEAAGLSTVSFKAVDGFHILAVDDMRGIASAITEHVQFCFTAEMALGERIDHLSLEAAKAWDIGQEWPPDI